MSGPFKLKYKNSAFPFKTDEEKKYTIKENLKRLKEIEEEAKIPKVTKEEVDTGDLKFYPERFV